MKSYEELCEQPRLSRDENVVRYVGGADYDAGTKTINGSAFERKKKDGDGVSVTRTLVLDSNDLEDEKCIRKIFASRLSLGKTAIFVQLNVGEALDVLREFSEDIFFCQNELEAEGEKLANPAHALIVGLPFKGEAVGSLKSELAGDRLSEKATFRFSAIVTA